MSDSGAVAVVGLSCRLPGAHDPEAFWSLLREGRAAITETPAERWAMYGLAAADEPSAGLRRGGFLDQVDRFDPDFFGISPREAAAMDPQQRLILELSWEALEDAGVPPAQLAGGQTGVYVGALSSDYAELVDQADHQTLTRHAFTGTERAIIANRVSYILGLRGPSLTVDTGQSSGLVAVHLACESLRTGESSLALAGGVNLNLAGRRALALAQFGALSPDGRCFTFDARANGFVRGEGGGVVALKPLERALADGDSIYCVIRGGAVNNDGGGDGLAAPQQQAQEELIRLAYERAGVDPRSVQYVELHGTGTPLGDKVEAAALGATLGAAREPDEALAVGSVKTNIGHLEAAAGVAGLIKAALSISRGQIPASLNFEEPNPEIPLELLRLRVQGELGSWPDPDSLLVAGVSSFGVGGTNCHVVLEQAPEPDRVGRKVSSADMPSIGVVPWVLSAKSASALATQAQRLVSHLRDRSGAGVLDVGYSLATARSAFEHRAVVLGDSREQLLAGTENLARGIPAANVIEGIVDPGASAGVVFVFPGQGSQWVGMGLELMERSPVFAAHLRACIDALSPHLDFSIEGVLRGDSKQPELGRVDVVQPTLFALMVSLARLWESSGVRPAVVVGHSQGEIAAAHIAGGLSLEDAARVVASRSRALASIAGRGGMLSVALPADQLNDRIGALGERVGIAAVNGPRSTVVSGDVDALQKLFVQFAAEEVRARMIPVDYASHSPDVEAVREQVLAALEPIAPRDGDVPLVSTVTGEQLDTSAMDAGYWYRGLRQPVLFERVIRELVSNGQRAFVEVSPHAVLTLGIQETVDEESSEPAGVTVVGTLRRDDGGPDRFMTSLGALHARGVEVDWEAFFAGSGAQRVRLPNYPFERERYWLESTSTPPFRPLDDATRAPAPEPVEPVPGQGRPATPRSFAERLEGLPAGDRDQFVLDVVLAHVASVSGHASADVLDPRRAFRELGFDSPAAVELRNRLGAATGLTLPAALVFDHPSPLAVRDFLLGELTGSETRSQETPTLAPVDEPLAIVGMACRFPGGVSSPEELWRLLESGGDAIGEFPTDRGWDLEGLYDPDPDRSGTSYTRNGGFLEGAGAFDAEHFAISPREALAMDPQQRLLLEVAWEALEDAGIDPAELSGTQTGVFAGAYDSDYGVLRSGTEELEGFRMTGGYLSVISGRLAYVLGCEGPAVSVDTACSSSLVALHLAGQALRQGDCSLALVGGVSVIASPTLFVDLSRQRALSPDGRCRAFGAGADGTGFSDGVGVLVLERLSDARRGGHRVLAVVRGSAVNQDGASNGLTAPNGPSQERVIRRALAVAGLEPGDVDAVEGHGTGTALGDPIEAGALLATYGRERVDGPLYLGSVKSNIGHTQAAAGVAGVIKMVLAMRHGVLPRTLYAEEPSPHVDWGMGDVKLLSDTAPWPAGARPRRAGISSFGISGTNAHVILEEPPVAGWVSEPAAHEPVFDAGVVPVLVSGSSGGALRGQAGRLRGFLEQRPGVDLGVVASGLAFGRGVLAHRGVALADGRDQLVSILGSLERGESVDGLVEGVARGSGRVAFVFPGQASQWVGMGVELLERSRVFARHLRECERALGPFIDWSLEGVLRGAPGAPGLDRVEVIHPALFAVMVSLARLWESVGVRADAVVGHSMGEIAAAHVAGGLSLGDAARAVVLRSRALAMVAGGDGAMLSVAVSADRLVERLGELDGRLWLGVVNGPGSVVVSGDRGALEVLRERCEALEIRARVIADVASHSPLMEEIRGPLLEALASLVPRSGEVPLYSTVTGGLLDTAEMGAEHWYRGVSQTVLFDPAVRGLVREGYRTFIEVSPHPVLTVAMDGIAEEESDQPGQVGVIASLRRDDGGPGRFLASLAEAHVHGVKVDWGALLDRRAAAEAQLPTYAFQHRHYWVTPQPSVQDAKALGQSSVEHPLLGAMVPLPDGEVLFTGRLSLETHPWLADHAVMGILMLPAGAFLELALYAAARVGSNTVEELDMAVPMVLDKQHATQIQVRVGASDERGSRGLSIHSRPEDSIGDEAGGWTAHASGVLRPDDDSSDLEPEELTSTAWPPQGAEVVELDVIYDTFSHYGIEIGPSLLGLRSVWRRHGEVLAEVALAESQADEANAFRLHPALLVASLQSTVLSVADADSADGAATPSLLSSLKGIRLYRPGASNLRASLRSKADTGGFSLALYDETGPVAWISEVTLTPMRDRLGHPRPTDSDPLLQVQWTPVSVQMEHASEAVLLRPDHGTPDSGLELIQTQLGVYADLESLGEAAGDRAPDYVLADFCNWSTTGESVQLPALTRAVLDRALALVQRWLEDERFRTSRLVFVTDSAISVLPDDDVRLPAAPLWGLMRSAQTEHPGRFVLVDLDGTTVPYETLIGALGSGEPQLAVRNGSILTPRLVRLVSDGADQRPKLTADGTVLIIGGTGGVGGHLARYLVTRHGVGHLLLASRRGSDAPGAHELRSELEELGAEVTLAACDVSERQQVKALLESVPESHPLTGVVHCAVGTDNAMVASLTTAQIDRAFRPKLDGAIHLHELTEHLELGLFVLCSSVAGIVGAPGVANYAAANVFLDALAAHRQARGRQATSLAWGLWDNVGASQALGEDANLAGKRTMGTVCFRALDADEMVERLDQALATDAATAVAVGIDRQALIAEARAGALPRLLAGLVPAQARHQTSDVASPDYAGSSPGERQRRMSHAIRAQIAIALGYESAEDLDIELSFLELGIDSLVGTELRKRLQTTTGLDIPTSVMFDHLTPTGLIDHLLAEMDLTSSPDVEAERHADADSLTVNEESGAGGLRPQSENGSVSSNGVTSLFRQAQELGKTDDAIEIVQAAARLRPIFRGDATEVHAPGLVTLAHGETQPDLFCFASVVATGGPHEYARLAKSFQGTRRILGVPAPGFDRGELLPDSLKTAIAAQGDAILRHAGDREVIFVGHSTGGLLAYAAAEHCSRHGVKPAGVVMIDSYSPQRLIALLPAACDRMIEDGIVQPALSDDRLTAMGSYLRLLEEWGPLKLDVPVLLITAEESLGALGENDVQSPCRSDVTLPGNHFSLMDGHAALTAEEIEKWLASELVRSRRLLERR